MCCDATIITGSVVVPPVFSSLMSTAVVATGQAFSYFATTSLPAVAVLSAVQTLLANTILSAIPNFTENKEHSLINLIAKYTISYAISAAIVFAVAVIAVQAGIISSFISLPAAAMVILANFAFGYIGTVGYLIGARTIQFNCCPPQGPFGLPLSDNHFYNDYDFSNAFYPFRSLSNAF